MQAWKHFKVEERLIRLMTNFWSLRMSVTSADKLILNIISVLGSVSAVVAVPLLNYYVSLLATENFKLPITTNLHLISGLVHCYMCRFFFKEHVRCLVWICRDPIFSDFRNAMIIFSNSSDPIRVPKTP